MPRCVWCLCVVRTDGANAMVGKVLLGQVVDELAIDEARDAVVDDLLALFAHACLLSLLDLAHDRHRVGLELGAKDLDLVGVHRRVADQDLGLLEALGLADAEALLQNEALLEVRVEQAATSLLDDVDCIEVAASLHKERGGVQDEYDDQGGGERVVVVVAP